MDESDLSLLDELRIIAQNGSEYAEDPYDRDRYNRILDLVSEQYSKPIDPSEQEVRDRFEEQLGHVTPNIGGRAAVINDSGQILHIKRTDDGTWGFTGGYAEPNETPDEMAVREAKEETGLSVHPVELVGLYNRPPDESNPHGFVGITYLCEVDGGTLEVSHEGEDLQYWDLDEVPEWHKDHAQAANDAMEIWKIHQQ
jgi:8-oxo-dGTP pyrophosphatase MutT (NUDIX family)